MQDSSLFGGSLVSFLALRDNEDRAKWIQSHAEWTHGEDWQKAWIEATYASFLSLHPPDRDYKQWQLAMCAVDLPQIQPMVRRFVEEWIETGFRPDGSEMPYQRAFIPKGRPQGEALADYMRNARSEAPKAIHAIAELHGAEIRPNTGYYSLDTIDMEKETRAERADRMQNASLEAQSKFQMLLDLRSPKTVLPDFRVVIGPQGGFTFRPDPFVEPTSQNLAAVIFSEFYCSELRFRLMRCNRCKAMVLPDRKPRTRYERGWHCDKCRNSAAAQSATDASRARFREQWFALAVDAYREYVSKPRRSTHDESAFLAERVNRNLPYSSRIKRHTITRNLTKIQAAAERRKRNAKG